MTDLPAPRILGSAEAARPLHPRQESDPTRDLRTLFESERDALFRFLWRLTSNASDAEDLLQETFLLAWTKPVRFTHREHLAAYFRRTAFRVFLNAKRKANRRRDLAPAPTSTSHESASRTVAEAEALAILRRHIHAAIQSLPEDTRRAFVLFRFENLTCAEIAELCGTTIDAVEGRIEHAMRELAVRLRPHRDNLPEA